mgnify:CR=1 FL=1
MAYYQDKMGKMKKRIQNGKRAPAEPITDAKLANDSAPSEAMVAHVRMVTSWIEGRKVSREEILAKLAEMRQRSIPKPGKTGDNVVRSNEHPP